MSGYYRFTKIVISMTRIVTILISVILFSASAFAQAPSSPSDQGDNSMYKSSYQRQVRNVGVAGVGVETIIDRWEKALPDDPEMMVARFSYNYAKARATEVVPKESKKYLGVQPILTLKDSLGADINYFEVPVFNDSIYGVAMNYLDKAVLLRPKEFRYTLYKVSSLLDYEQENPDMAAGEILSLIDKYKADKSLWTLDGEPLGEDVFCQAIGEYCYSLFQVANPLSYKYFLNISEKMNKLYPKDPVFLNNIGSYWQIAQNNSRKALSYYKKVLKIAPDDYAANTNIRIINLQEKAKKKKKK